MRLFTAICQGSKDKRRSRGQLAIGCLSSPTVMTVMVNGEGLLTVVRHYVAKMSKGVISAMHSGWSERYQGRLKVTPNLPLGARVMGPW